MSPSTFDHTGVSAMGRISLSTSVCFTFGMDMIMESFHKTCTSPEDKDVLNIDVTDSASS